MIYPIHRNLRYDGGMKENYIPLRKSDLCRAILNDESLDESRRASLSKFFQMLEVTLHYQYHARLESLKAEYAPFDPDCDLPLGQRQCNTSPQNVERFFQSAIALLERANFRRLDHENLIDALDQASALGINLDIDFTVFERLDVYTRGTRTVTKPLPGVLNTMRKRTITLPVHSRLVVIFRLKDNKRLPQPVDTNTIFLKIFKDIPKSDVEMLLPGTRVRMTWFDQSKIMVPIVSGVGITLLKIVQVTIFVAAMSVYGLLAIITGTIGYGAKSYFSYVNTKDRYHLSLTRNLYYQKLDSNAGVLFRLLDEAEEQEFREVIIAYFMLWKHGSSKGCTIDEIDLAAEQFITAHCGTQCDFEETDAIDKLVNMKLIRPAPGGLWKALDLDDALEVLDSTWDALFGNKCGQDRAGVPSIHRNEVIETLADAGDCRPVL